MSRLVSALGFCALAAAAPARAQRVHDVPPRPNIGSIADTNNAELYWEHGMEVLARNPAEAAAAFYWAGRLDPERAEYLYARADALMLTDPNRMLRFHRWERAERRDPEIRSIDSLYMRSLILDPFHHASTDATYWFELVKLDFADWVRSNGGWIESNDLRFVIRYVLDRDPAYAATLAFSTGSFSEALGYWGRAARRNPRNPYIRARRATAFYLMGAFDSARVQLEDALRIGRRRDADSTLFVYESKAQWEFGLGRIHERMGNQQAARESYERALVEDLAYYPANVRMGLAHIALGDTASAMREFARAIAVKEDEYVPRATYGYFLAATGQLDSAAAHLRRAVELEPHAAAPRLMLGQVLDAQGNRVGTLEAFEAFLARAARRDRDRPTIQARVQALRGGRE